MPGDMRRLGACALAAVLGFAATVETFRPGHLSPDSFHQWKEAQAGIYDGWNPPLMSWIWRVTDHILPGPAGMLVLHNLLFWSALGLLAYLLARSPIRAAASVLAVGFWPPVLALLGTIWKDVGMGVALTAAFALLLAADRRRSRPALAGAIVCLFYACAVRLNGSPAALVPALWAGALGLPLLAPGRTWSTVARLAAGVAVFAVVTGSAFGVSRLLVGGPLSSNSKIVLMHDLAALSLAAGRVQMPAYVLQRVPDLSLEDLRARLDPRSQGGLFSGDRALPLKGVPGNMPALRRAWLAAVLDQPGAWLRHRARVFGLQLGIGSEETCYPFAPANDPTVPIAISRTPLNGVVMSILDRLKDTVLFRGWFYLLALPVLAGAAWWLQPERRALAVGLAASALCYTLPFFFISPACDFRFNWWAVVATANLPLVAFGGIVGRGAQPSRRSRASSSGDPAIRVGRDSGTS